MTKMDDKDIYIRELEKEIDLLFNWIIRQKKVSSDWSEETTRFMFEIYKKQVKANGGEEQ